MREPPGGRRHASLLHRRAKGNWRNLKSASSRATYKHSLLRRHRMRLRRNNSLRSSKLARSLRSSVMRHHGSKARSPLHLFNSPETLTKKGKIRRVSERSIHKASNPPVAQSEREKGDAFSENRRMTRGMEGADTMKTMGMDTPRSLKRKGPYGEKIQTQGKLMSRIGLRNRDVFDRYMKIDSASYRTKLRTKEGTTTESKEKIHQSKGANSVLQKNSSRLDINEGSSKSFNEAGGLLKTMHKQENLMPGGGVTTRQKSSSIAIIQPALDVERGNEVSQHIGGYHLLNSVLHSNEGSLEGKTKRLKKQLSRGRPEEVDGRLFREDTHESLHSAQDQTINSECKLEESCKAGNRSAVLEHSDKMRLMNALDDPRQRDSDEDSLCPARSPRTANGEGPLGTSNNLKDCTAKLRRSKRKRSPIHSEYLNDHRAPWRSFTGVRGQTEDVAVQDAPILEQGNAVVGEKIASIHRVVEDEMGLNVDVIKMDPASKSCLVATNPTETGGRQMRPRPLDLEQPLLVLVEGMDEDYYELDGGSFYRMLQQQPELKSPCASQAKSNGSSKKVSHAVDATGEKAEPIIIPSFRSCIDPDESLKHPAVQYELPHSYIKAGPIIEQLQAEYDVDDDDEEWLNKYNQSVSPSSTLSVDQFEKMIDLLENKAADATGINSIADSFEEDQEPASEECCICNGGENSPNNPVYECANCHILVHQSCYGIQKGWRRGKKRRKWICKKCEAVADGKVSADISCSLCCKQGGALKPSTEPHRWAHIVCALYTNETYFVNPDAMEPIDGLDAADARAKRQKRQCWLCGMREGSVERCSVPGCKALFHVSCGVIQGAAFELQHSNHQVTSVRLYCPRHALKALEAAKGRSREGEKQTSSPKPFNQGFSGTEDLLHVEKRSGIPPTRKHGERELSSYSKNHGKDANKDSVTNWELPSKVCVLSGSAGKENINDSVLGEKVNGLLKGKAMTEEVLSEEECKEELGHTNSDLMEGVYLYWVSKRAKQGGPLLHRIQQEQAAKQFGIFNPDDEGGPAVDAVAAGSFLDDGAIDMKVLAARRQLQMLWELTLLVVRRERLKLEIFSLDQDILKVGLEALNATNISQLCSSCKGSHLSLACAVCSRATCMYCLTKSSRYGSWRDFLMHPKYVCLDCEKQDIQMHIELACRPLADPEEDGLACSSMIHPWNEECGSDLVLKNSQITLQKRPYILLPRCDCSHQDKLATQAFWEQTHSKTALVLDLLKNPIQMSGC